MHSVCTQIHCYLMITKRRINKYKHDIFRTKLHIFTMASSMSYEGHEGIHSKHRKYEVSGVLTKKLKHNKTAVNF